MRRRTIRLMIDQNIDRGREDTATYALELKVPCKSPGSTFNAPEPEKRRLNLPLNNLLTEPKVSCSSGRGRFALAGGFPSVDGPGFDGEAGGG